MHDGGTARGKSQIEGCARKIGVGALELERLGSCAAEIGSSSKKAFDFGERGFGKVVGTEATLLWTEEKVKVTGGKPASVCASRKSAVTGRKQGGWQVALCCFNMADALTS